ncbi:TPA: hypothetical protein CPT80_03270 [Candidatus Gastranaerophilales bacterium HUM_9]|nr:MAG TPA: hypothetical protein CPT80_03270 [Candidatus Gastranaerophilales bacterium HUM_9]HBX34889.1 hypothetical protein [Cyanobacteria bacterium UBA11440]
MSDWNVFYSSLAQSTAAFVGLLGAFIITKIINNEQQFNENKILIEDCIVTANNLKMRLKDRYFNWYNTRIREKAFEKIEDNSYDDNNILYKSPEIIYNEYKFSEFDQKSEVLVAIKEQQEKLLGGNHENE